MQYIVNASNVLSLIKSYTVDMQTKAREQCVNVVVFITTT